MHHIFAVFQFQMNWIGWTPSHRTNRMNSNKKNRMKQASSNTLGISRVISWKWNSIAVVQFDWNVCCLCNLIDKITRQKKTYKIMIHWLECSLAISTVRHRSNYRVKQQSKIHCITIKLCSCKKMANWASRLIPINSGTIGKMINK